MCSDFLNGFVPNCFTNLLGEMKINIFPLPNIYNFNSFSNFAVNINFQDQQKGPFQISGRANN
jgi:hypothetical protein